VALDLCNVSIRLTPLLRARFAVALETPDIQHFRLWVSETVPGNYESWWQTDGGGSCLWATTTGPGSCGSRDPWLMPAALWQRQQGRVVLRMRSWRVGVGWEKMVKNGHVKKIRGTL
jgi:hypothetical protein